MKKILAYRHVPLGIGEAFLTMHIGGLGHTKTSFLEREPNENRTLRCGEENTSARNFYIWQDDSK